MLCVTKTQSDVIEISELFAYEEYFLQHTTINQWSSALSKGSSVQNMLNKEVQVQTGTQNTGFHTYEETAAETAMPTAISSIIATMPYDSSGWFLIQFKANIEVNYVLYGQMIDSNFNYDQLGQFSDNLAY